MMLRILFSILALATMLTAASIDGKWTGEVKPAGRKADAKALPFTLDVKSEGEALTGSVTVQNPKGKGRSLSISEGKITGETFRFVTVQKTKDGENKIVWSGSVKGDELSGSRGKDGAKRAPAFTAKRAQ